MPSLSKPTRKTCFAATALAACALVLGNAQAASPAARWATGPALQRRLGQEVDIVWSGSPLRQAMAGLSRAQQVAILIDRRVDPGQKVDLTLNAAPMETALHAIAEHLGLGVARLGAVVYLGPPEAAARLRPIATALETEVRRLPAARQRKFFQSKPMAWDDLATPRDILAGLAERNDLEIGGLERIPHDLWAAADLPPLSLIDRLTLVAVQFDLAVKVAREGARIELVPAPDDLPSIPVELRSRDSTASKHPPSQTSVRVERMRIQRLSIQEKPLGPVLRELAERLGLELRIDEEAIRRAGISLDQRVTVKVENASVDTLFHELLKSTGLTFRRRDKVVEIGPDKQDARTGK